MSGLRVRDEGAVRVLTFARAPGNALDLATLADLRRAALDAAGDASVRALLLDSVVDGYFSSGLDLEELMSLPEARRREPFEALIAAYRALLACPKPTVAALSGSAILGGWIVAMACDWRLAAPGAKVALSEIRAALSPTTGLIRRLSALASDPRVVKEMVLRGKSLGAADAAAAALVDEVVPDAELAAAALKAAGRLAKSPPRAYAEIKRALNAEAADEALWDRSLAEFAAVFAGAEAAEGVAALRAKRRPRWEAA
ncbi:MAG: enoyl-CoA hydratase/isomerase family protein [Elusimicrobia bacterium]|nr:enoyl-CoA hydratase/isomerase family protein [Elusimicrobiota bacterium]